MSDMRREIDARMGLSGKTIDRLLTVYTAAYSAHVRAGDPPSTARMYSREACEDFKNFVIDEATAAHRSPATETS